MKQGRLNLYSIQNSKEIHLELDELMYSLLLTYIVDYSRDIHIFITNSNLFFVEDLDQKDNHNHNSLKCVAVTTG